MRASGLSEISRLFRLGELGADELIVRLAAVFEALEPSVEAFVPEAGRFERLRAEAARLTEAFPDAAIRPPLFGTVVGVKDIFHVDGLPTGAGSRLPVDELAGPEAECVAALRRQGALIAGKTVSTEFAYFAPGVTHNPHHPEHTPGGSSSGSAAAVAAGLADLALGTQTIGSISRPAAYCGTVGFKPSFGRVSTAGVVPLAPSLDHVGLFADWLGPIGLAAATMCRDWRPTPARVRPMLAIPEGPYLERASDEGRAHFVACVETLEAAGYTLRAVAALSDFDEIEARHHRLVAAEAAAVHERWYGQHRDLYHPTTRDLLERGSALSVEQIDRDRTACQGLLEALTDRMTANDVDLWISPAAPGAAPHGLDSTGDPVMNLPWTQAGLPTVSLPSGWNPEGLPLGLQVAGRFGSDETLLAWAAGLSEVLGFAQRASVAGDGS